MGPGKQESVTARGCRARDAPSPPSLIGAELASIRARLALYRSIFLFAYLQLTHVQLFP
jgi:hypothetical protein